MNLDRLAAEFDRCAPWIEAALPYCFGNYELSDVRDACLAGQMQLWPGERSAAVTEIHRWPRRTGIHVLFAGGELDELREQSAVILAWAKSKGCDHATVTGREGWARALGFGNRVSTNSRLDI